MTVRTLIGTMHVSADPIEARAVRAWVRKILGYKSGNAVDEITVPLIEVVTNSILHSRSGIKDSSGKPGEIYIALLCVDHAIRVEVSDEGPREKGGRPQIRSGGLIEQSGRGLKMVNAYSAGKWGFDQHVHDGEQTVWFEISTQRRAENEPACVS
ncbi:MAG: ATP-binding protein [Streptomycetales bacterium]